MSRRAKVLFSLLAVASLAIAAALWREAFPIAGLKFRASRAEAQSQLAALVESLGYSLDGYHAAAGFGEDTDAKEYLELAHGVPRLEALTRDGVSLWYWTVRWFKPEQHEEFSAWLDPQRRVTGFSHTIEEEREGASLDPAAALALAEDFLRRHVTHHPFERLRFVSDSSERRLHRVDYYFEWERDDLRAGDAPYRLNVGIQGDTIGSYGESLEVPENWTRDFEKKREVNQLCFTIAMWALLPIAVGLFVMFVVYLRRHQLRVRAIPWGWLVFFAAVLVGGELSNIPSFVFDYETTVKWGSFVSSGVMQAARNVGFGVAGMWILIVIADAFHREGLPQHPTFRRALGPLALRDPHTLRALGLGIVFAATGLAYVSSFYVIAQRFGAWCPVEIEYVEAFNGWLPWIAPLHTGLTAAFGEELLFRVIGILLYVKVFRVRWLAVLLAGATWAFLHSYYAQMPGYIRGVELTAEGALWGVLFLRFGIVTTLTTHYLYNCWLGSLIVLQSPSWLDKAGALAVSLWPVALFAWGVWLRFRGVSAADFPGELAEPPPLPVALHARAEPAWDFSPRTLPRRRLWIVALASGSVIATLFWLPDPQGEFSNLGAIELSRARIAERADETMNRHGFDPASYRRIVTLSSNSVPSTYLLEHGSLNDVAQLFHTEFADLAWYVRYFRILEPEEFSLQLDKQGRLLRWSHTIPREAPGASLDREAALAIAREALARDFGMNLANETLVSDFSTKQENRLDHSFTFERNDWKRGEARLRTSISVQGNEAVDFYRWIKTPEAWSRSRAKSGWRKFFVEEFNTWLGIAKSIVIGALFVLLLRKHLVPWRLGFGLALIPTALEIFETIGNVPWFFSGYATTTPLAHFLVRQVGGGAVSLVGSYLSDVLSVSVALGFLRWAFGWTSAALVVWPRARTERREFWVRTLVLVCASIALFWLQNGLHQFVSAAWLPARLAYFTRPSVNTALPWLDALVRQLHFAWDKTLGLAIVAAILVIAWRRFPRVTICVTLIQPVANAARAADWPAFFYSAGTGEFSLLLTGFLLLAVWRFNFVLIFLAYFCYSLLGEILVFLFKGGPEYRWEALPLICIPVAVIALGWWRHRVQARARST